MTKRATFDGIFNMPLSEKFEIERIERSIKNIPHDYDENIIINVDKNKQHHWFLNFSASLIKKEWYTSKNVISIRNNDSSVVEFAHKLNQKQKDDLIENIQIIINLGISDSREIYQKLYREKSLPVLSGVVLSFKSVVRYATQILNGGLEEKQILHKKIVEMYKSGVTKRKILQHHFGCHKMVVYEALKDAGIVIKRSEMDKATVIKKLLDDGKTRHEIESELHVSLSYIDKVRRDHKKSKLIDGINVSMEAAA